MKQEVGRHHIVANCIIHASMTEMAKHDKNDKELMSLIETKQLNYGYIICKCNLVDCIYMTKEYVEKMKK